MPKLLAHFEASRLRVKPMAIGRMPPDFLLLLLLLWCIQTKISLTSNLTAAILSFYAQDFFFFPPPVVWIETRAVGC